MESPVFWDITVCSLEKRQHERPRRCDDREVGCENGRVDESGPGYCPVALLLAILNRGFCYYIVTLLSVRKQQISCEAVQIRGTVN
jgi:hypothetical protein